MICSYTWLLHMQRVDDPFVYASGAGPVNLHEPGFRARFAKTFGERQCPLWTKRQEQIFPGGFTGGIMTCFSSGPSTGSSETHR